MSNVKLLGNIATGRVFFEKLVNGDFGLAQSYWLYLVLVSFIFNIILSFVTSIVLFLFLLFIFAVYWMIAAFGTWKAANKYSGNLIWPILAKTAVSLGAIMLLLSLFVAFSMEG